jgi:ArsR family transcriptional regulator
MTSISKRKPSTSSPDPAACCPAEKPGALDRLASPVADPAADKELAAFAKALGHPVRVRILRMLAGKDARMCSHIVDDLPLAQSTVSEHLRILRSAGLVQMNDSGPRAGYCIVPSALKRLKALLQAM